MDIAVITDSDAETDQPAMDTAAWYAETAVRQLRDMGYRTEEILITDDQAIFNVLRQDGAYLYTSTISRTPGC